MTATVIFAEAPDVVVDWLRNRQDLGQDGHDEMWNGEYYVPPMANSRHGDVGMQVSDQLNPRARRARFWPVGEVNIGLSKDDFRVPDLGYIRGREHAVYLPTAAIVVEIVSPHDRSYVKLDFYHDRGVDEVLIVDPQRRTVEWYTRGADAFERTGASVLLGIDEQTLHAEIDWPPTA